MDVGSHHIEISWNPPIPSERNGELRHYMISLTRLDTSSSPVIHNIPTSSTIHYIRYYNITGLHPYTRYNIVVAAVTIGPGTITSSAVTTKQKRTYIYIFIHLNKCSLFCSSICTSSNNHSFKFFTPNFAHFLESTSRRYTQWKFELLYN